MDIRPHASKLVGLAVAITALSLSFGGWALASHSNSAPYPGTQSTPTMPLGGTLYGDEIYKVENGVVYEWDDGRWKPEYDKKIENGIVYDFDDGRWKTEYDPNTYKAQPQNTPQQTAPTQQNQPQVAPQPAPKAPAQNNVAPQNNTRPNSKYKVENGVVYEWDDGRWEPEYDKKAQNGSIYEYDDGRWERDDDDWDDDWDD